LFRAPESRRSRYLAATEHFRAHREMQMRGHDFRDCRAAVGEIRCLANDRAQVDNSSAARLNFCFSSADERKRKCEPQTPSGDKAAAGAAVTDRSSCLVAAVFAATPRASNA